MSNAPGITQRDLGLAQYEPTWQAMREFTDHRTRQSADELWLCEHPPVYTLGQAGREEHIHNAAGIAVVKSDRGGQVTYHGPGQLVVYCLIDLRRAGFGIRDMVVRLENSVIALLADLGIEALGRRDAPGVYVDGAKIAALGLRVRRGCSYHGIALNADVELEPFAGIDPCGYQGLEVTSVKKLGVSFDKSHLADALVHNIHNQLAPEGTLV